jgi:ubiquinone/menaquinone biosynthesis C-methylase UbiE
LGYFLINPFRRISQNPMKILGPFVAEGMTVLEPGPGMGFFTLDLARLVGPRGKVVTVDLQQRMLDGMKRRARKAGVADRIEARLVKNDGLGVEDLAGQVDFALAFAMVHELPDQRRFFAEVFQALKPGGKLLVAEPKGHVTTEAFAATLALAGAVGFRADSRPAIRASRTAVLVKA